MQQLLLQVVLAGAVPSSNPSSRKLGPLVVVAVGSRVRAVAVLLRHLHLLQRPPLPLLLILLPHQRSRGHATRGHDR